MLNAHVAPIESIGRLRFVLGSLIGFRCCRAASDCGAWTVPTSRTHRKSMSPRSLSPPNAMTRRSNRSWGASEPRAEYHGGELGSGSVGTGGVNCTTLRCSRNWPHPINP